MDKPQELNNGDVDERRKSQSWQLQISLLVLLTPAREHFHVVKTLVALYLLLHTNSHSNIKTCVQKWLPTQE